MGTTGRENHPDKPGTLPWIFKGRQLRTGHHKNAVLYQPKGHFSA